MWFNSMKPRDTIKIFHSGYDSTKLLYYLDQVWLPINDVCRIQLRAIFQWVLILYDVFRNYDFKISATPPRGQRYGDTELSQHWLR